MSRSRKHSPAGGNCTPPSDHDWKREGNRRIRRTNRVLIRIGRDPEPKWKLYDAYKSPKDGHRWYGEYDDWERK